MSTENSPAGSREPAASPSGPDTSHRIGFEVVSGPCFTSVDSERKEPCDCRSGKFQVQGSDYANKLVFCEHCKHNLSSHEDFDEGGDAAEAQGNAQNARESPAKVTEPAAPSDDEQEEAIREIGVP